MATIPAGVFNGAAMASFRLGSSPVTNAEYAAHVDRSLDAPYVLLTTDRNTGVTSLVEHSKSLEYLLGNLAKELPQDWDSRDPFTIGALDVFQLRKDMSPRGFRHPNKPVVNMSWFHAFEYCTSNGLSLPTDDQWSYAAGVHEGREHATSTGRLYAADGKTKLAHFGADKKDKTNRTISVNDPRYPDGPHGLRHMTGNVWEWTAMNQVELSPWGLRGGSWSAYDDVESRHMWTFRRFTLDPDVRLWQNGFRVSALAPQG